MSSLQLQEVIIKHLQEHCPPGKFGVAWLAHACAAVHAQTKEQIQRRSAASSSLANQIIAVAHDHGFVTPEQAEQVMLMMESLGPEFVRMVDVVQQVAKNPQVIEIAEEVEEFCVKCCAPTTK